MPPLPHPAQPNVPALLAALRGGDGTVLEALADAAPPEAEADAEAWLESACRKSDAADDSAADAIALLRAIEASTASPAIARALAHPNAGVRDAAALALGEFRYTPALGRIVALRSDAALVALEMMFQRKFFGGPWAEMTGRPRKIGGKRDWGEFDAWWEENRAEAARPLLKPEEVTAGIPIAEVLDRLPGSHRVMERHGYRCIARIGRDIEECVAVEKETLEEGARLHGKELAPLLADLAALARKIATAEKTDEVEVVGPTPPPAP